MGRLGSVCAAMAVVAAGSASAETKCTLQEPLASGSKVTIDDGQGNWTVMRAFQTYGEKEGGFESYQLLHDRGSTMPLHAGLREINVSRDGDATLYGYRFNLSCHQP